MHNKKILQIILLFVFIGASPFFRHYANAACGTDTVSRDGLTYGTVVAADGKCWLDRNLGATRIATSLTDTLAYGWLFQWGRGVDGHQLRTSGATTTLSSSDSPGHASFIRATNSPFDWRSPQNHTLWQGLNGTNNPCPTGFRLPTKSEWFALTSAENISNKSTAFGSSLKLTAGGYRASGDGSIYSIGTVGYYWSSSVSTPTATSIYLDNPNAPSDINRATGASVRCISNTLPVLPSTVTTQIPTSITSTTAIGNGTVTSTGGENPTRYVEWGTTNGGPYPYSCSAGTGSTGSYSCNLTDLSPITTYYVRAKATNGAGTSYGSQVIFTTPAGNASVSTSSSLNIQEHTATLNAEITNIGIENPSRFIEYGIQSGNYTSECTAGTGGAGVYSCNIANLIPNSTYYYRAKATNSAGTSYGIEMSFTTLALQDTTIADPNPTDVVNAVNEGYFTLNSGTIDNTESVTTTVNVTIQDTIFNAVFPTNTTITEQSNGNFNFQFLTAQNVTQSVQQEQPTSRAAVRIGIPGEKLNFSQNITLTVSIGEAFNGQTLDILYQQENESTWNTHGTCTVTNGECVFTTDHATMYTINGVHQATGDVPMNLNVQVQETLSMNCFDPSDSNTTVSLGTSANPGLITAGMPAVGQSRCTVITNADQGYYLTLTNANPANATLIHTDPHTGTIYEIADQSAWNETTKTTFNWTAPTTKGLGFSVISFPEADTTHNQFNGVWNITNDCPEGLSLDTNNYAGMPTTPQAISAVTSYQGVATITNICYKVDVPASQPSGQYSGQVMFTATSDASGYWE